MGHTKWKRRVHDWATEFVEAESPNEDEREKQGRALHQHLSNKKCRIAMFHPTTEYENKFKTFWASKEEELRERAAAATAAITPALDIATDPNEPAAALEAVSTFEDPGAQDAHDDDLTVPNQDENTSLLPAESSTTSLLPVEPPMASLYGAMPQPVLVHLTGPRRTSCDACRKRKTKCDQVKPACTSCRKRESECLYTHSFGFESGPFHPLLLCRPLSFPQTDESPDATTMIEPTAAVEPTTEMGLEPTDCDLAGKEEEAALDRSFWTPIQDIEESSTFVLALSRSSGSVTAAVSNTARHGKRHLLNYLFASDIPGFDVALASAPKVEHHFNKSPLDCLNFKRNFVTILKKIKVSSLRPSIVVYSLVGAPVSQNFWSSVLGALGRDYGSMMVHWCIQLEEMDSLKLPNGLPSFDTGKGKRFLYSCSVDNMSLPDVDTSPETKEIRKFWEICKNGREVLGAGHRMLQQHEQRKRNADCI